MDLHDVLGMFFKYDYDGTAISDQSYITIAEMSRSQG